MTSLRGVMIFLLLLNVSVACENGDPVSPSTPPPPPPITPAFSGQVLIPSYQRIRNYSVPVEGVTVTIIAGPRSGERAQTNHNGRYTFPEVDGEELHIRLEKDGHEPKEVIVHRTRATTLQDRLPLEYGGPQDKPGTVLIGIVWPEYAKQIMEKMPVVADLLMIIVPGGRGQYGQGFIVQDDPRATPELGPLPHELCHAYQHGVVRPRGGGAGSGTGGWHSEWVSSLEGRAYREAREADRREIGYNAITVLDQTGGSWTESQLILVEESANFCNFWWGSGYQLYDIDYWRAWLRKHAPNRAQWLERFLGL